jgi:hypothetical protein
MSCGISWTGETPQERSDEEAQRQPRRIWSLKKLALELFHNSSPAESEAPGTEINGPFLQAAKRLEGAQKFLSFGTPSF